MTRYIALLGSINVGGNRLKMAELREALEREEFEDVETVVASGNVLFSHEKRPSEGLSEKIAHIVRERFGIDSFAAVRSEDELERAIDENPFAADGDPKFVHTIFLSDELDRDAFERFAQLGHLEPVAADVDRTEQGDVAGHLLLMKTDWFSRTVIL